MYPMVQQDAIRTIDTFGAERGQFELFHAPHKLRPRFPNVAVGPPGYGSRTPSSKVFLDLSRY